MRGPSAILFRTNQSKSSRFMTLRLYMRSKMKRFFSQCNLRAKVIDRKA